MFHLPEMWLVDQCGGNQRTSHIQTCKHWHAEVPHQIDRKTPGHQDANRETRFGIIFPEKNFMMRRL